MSRATIVLISTHGVVTLRNTLHSLWETAADGYDLIVLARHRQEDVATYLTRQYLRGRIAGFGFDAAGPREGHCGLDRAFPFLSGEYLFRLDDDLAFEPEWLDKSIAALDAHPEIGCLALVRISEQRRRGRPPKPRLEPEVVDEISMRCFATRRALVERHQRELMGECVPGSCMFQTSLKQSGATLAYLAGLVKPSQVADRVIIEGGIELEADLPFHGGATGAIQRIEQAYQLGDDALMTCMSCGNNELEVLAAKIEFCSQHQAAIGYTYTLRCEECHELHYEEDLQFRCAQ